MTEYEKVIFHLNGGWPAVIMQLAMNAAKYTAIGFFLHLGWKLL